MPFDNASSSISAEIGLPNFGLTSAVDAFLAQTRGLYDSEGRILCGEPAFAPIPFDGAA